MAQREIRVRAWDTEDNEIYIPEALGICKDGSYMPLRLCKDGNRAYKPHPIMQFTGLHDKNGKEIYEGDIVKDTLTGANLEVKFGHNKNNAYHGWYCKYINADVRDTNLNGDYDINKNNFIEVIGNIYENPDLLK